MKKKFFEARKMSGLLNKISMSIKSNKIIYISEEFHLIHNRNI